MTLAMHMAFVKKKSNVATSSLIICCMSLGSTIRRGAQEEGEKVWARTKKIKQGGIVEGQKSANLSEEALSCYMACDNKSKSSTSVFFF